MVVRWRVLGLEQDVCELHATEDYFLNVASLECPVLIFSKITRPGVSVSVRQDVVKDVDVERCRREGVVMTRRTSGGRSVLLDENYIVVSVVARPEDVAARNYVEAYRFFCDRVASSLSSCLGGASFVVDEKNDVLLFDGRKIGGVAQRRHGGRVLLHGYVRYAKRWEYWLRFLKIDDHPLSPFVEDFNGFTTSVSEIGKVSRDAVVESLLEGVVGGCEYLCDVLSPEEKWGIGAKVLLYTAHSWVFRTGEGMFSRGNCDLIAGSELRIKSLEGKVRYR